MCRKGRFADISPGYRLDKNMRIDAHRPAPEDEDVFLADFVADPREQVNLADDPKFHEVRRRLSALLDEHAKGAVEVPPERLERPERGKNRLWKNELPEREQAGVC